VLRSAVFTGGKLSAAAATTAPCHRRRIKAIPHRRGHLRRGDLRRGDLRRGD
jgi:hypothetical protein